MTEITPVGLDLAKPVVSLCGEDASGRVVVQRTLRREAVIAWFVQRPPCLVGMEACCVERDHSPPAAPRTQRSCGRATTAWGVAKRRRSRDQQNESVLCSTAYNSLGYYNGSTGALKALTAGRDVRM